MSRPIIDGILTMSNNAINETLTPLIILLLEQNTLGPIYLIQTIMGANHLILYKNKKKDKKDVHAYYILYT